MYKTEYQLNKYGKHIANTQDVLTACAMRNIGYTVITTRIKVK